MMTRPRGRMDLDAYKRVIDQIGGTLILIQFWNQGEPFLHTQFVEMIRYTKQKGIAAMTSTNGHFLDSESRVNELIASGLDEIIISLDGMDQKSYAAYRVGGQFQKVVDGIRLLSERKRILKSKTPIINLQFLVMKHNEAQVPEIQRLAKELGVNVLQLKSAQVYSEDQAETFLPDDESFRLYQFDGKSYRIKSGVPNWCKFLWYGAVLNWDGSLAPCCFDKDGRFNYGNVFLNGTDVSAIWKNPESRQFRSRILHERKEIDICGNCFEGMKQDFTRYVPISPKEK
jgi:MoaA/NifB/PqqE/SkfB family radical SAM enzyme